MSATQACWGRGGHLSGGEAGVFRRGPAKHWLAPGENGGSGTFSHVWGGLGLFSGVSSIWNSRGKPEDAKPLGGGRVGGREALIRELGLRVRPLSV